MDLDQNLQIMAAFNYGWIKALLYAFTDDSWDKLIKRTEIVNLIVSQDDGVIDIEIGDSVHGSIALSVYEDKENNSWYLDDVFDVYDEDSNLIADNYSLSTY